MRNLRIARAAELAAINDIYNHFVLHSTCTYQTEPETIEARRAWFDRHEAQHPIIVAMMNDQVVGWGSLSPFHPRAAYSRTVENSVYVHHEFHRRGIGGLILEDLIQRATAIGHHTIIALISADQTASVALHERAGFKTVGEIQEVGHKFGRWLDVLYMQKML